MGKGRTTIHDIARELNVTASTVSRALNNHPSIGSVTKQAVQEMAVKLNYRPNHLAAALRRGKSNIVGVMVPTADRSFFSTIVRGIEEIVYKAGYIVSICQANDSYQLEKSIIETLLRTQVDGIIASVAKGTTDFKHYQKILDNQVPLILYDRVAVGLDTSMVTIDDYHGALQATTHLIEQGCKNIVHFAGPQHMNIYKDRQRGYEDALQKHSLPTKAQNILENRSLDLEFGKKAAHQLLKYPERPDGIFSASDFSALGAMQVLKMKNIHIPQDIAIIGFSNEPFTTFVEPALTTVDQKTQDMGRFAAKLFLEQMKDVKGFTNRRAVLSPQLIVRSSSLRNP